MRQCPKCQRVYSEDTQLLCRSDGTRLLEMPAVTSAAPTVPSVLAAPASPVPPTGLAFPSTPVTPHAPINPQSVSKPRNLTSCFVIGAIVLVFGGGLVLLIGGVSLYLMVKAQPIRMSSSIPDHQMAPPPFAGSSTPPATTPPADMPPVDAPPATSPTDAAPVDEASLKSAIRLADDAEIQALATLDPAPLSQAFTGEALRTELKKVQDYKSKGIFVEAHLDKQEIESFKVSPDGSKVEVKIVETWSNTVYTVANRQIVESKPGQAEPQIISLVRGKEGWLVYSDVPQ